MKSAVLGPSDPRMANIYLCIIYDTTIFIAECDDIRILSKYG